MWRNRKDGDVENLYVTCSSSSEEIFSDPLSEFVVIRKLLPAKLTRLRQGAKLADQADASGERTPPRRRRPCSSTGLDVQVFECLTDNVDWLRFLGILLIQKWSRVVNARIRAIFEKE